VGLVPQIDSTPNEKSLSVDNSIWKYPEHKIKRVFCDDVLNSASISLTSFNEYLHALCYQNTGAGSPRESGILRYFRENGSPEAQLVISDGHAAAPGYAGYTGAQYDNQQNFRNEIYAFAAAHPEIVTAVIPSLSLISSAVASPDDLPTPDIDNTGHPDFFQADLLHYNTTGAAREAELVKARCLENLDQHGLLFGLDSGLYANLTHQILLNYKTTAAPSNIFFDTFYGTWSTTVSVPTVSAGWTTFDGTDDLLTFLGKLAAGDFTLLMWVDPDNTAGSESIMRVSGGGKFWGVYYDYNNNKIGFSDNGEKTGLTQIAASTSPFFYALRYDAASQDLKIRVNGGADTTLTGYTVNLDALADTIEVGGTAAGTKFTGKLASLRIYSRSLTDAQVAAWFAQGAPTS